MANAFSYERIMEFIKNRRGGSLHHLPLLCFYFILYPRPAAELVSPYGRVLVLHSALTVHLCVRFGGSALFSEVISFSLVYYKTKLVAFNFEGTHDFTLLEIKKYTFRLNLK